MHEDTVVAFRQPGSFSDDPLTDVLRAGARQLLGQAIEAEVEAHIAAHADLTDAKGRRRVVRHGYLPEREIQTGIGAVRVKAPRVRDRDPAMTGGRIGFTSSILPPYLRRSQSMEALLPWLWRLLKFVRRRRWLMMLCCLHDGFNGTVGLSLSQVFRSFGGWAAGDRPCRPEGCLGLQQAGGIHLRAISACLQRLTLLVIMAHRCRARSRRCWCRRASAGVRAAGRDG